MKKILPLFSYLFHPIFTPIFGTLLFFSFTNTPFEWLPKYLLLLQVVIITLIIPIAFIYLLKTYGAVDSFMLSKTAQRKMPLFVQILMLLILIQKSITTEYTPELFYFFLGGMLSSLFAFVLLFVKIKASIHLIGMGALTVFLMGLSIHFQKNSLHLISFFILMIGVVASSRLEMKAHTLKELLIGLCVGVLPQIILLPFWL